MAIVQIRALKALCLPDGKCLAAGETAAMDERRASGYPKDELAIIDPPAPEGSGETRTDPPAPEGSGETRTDPPAEEKAAETPANKQAKTPRNK